MSEGKSIDNTIVPLQHTEAPAVQTEALYSLQASLGPDESRDVIERAVFELSDRLWLIQKSTAWQRNGRGTANRTQFGRNFSTNGVSGIFAVSVRFGKLYCAV